MRENEIRPAKILNEYLRLSAEDARELIQASGPMGNRPCPACGETDINVEFQKNGFDLGRCSSCFSLFVINAPGAEQLLNFYQNSRSQRYWANTFFPAVAEARREKIFRPRVDKILQIINDLCVTVESVLDVGSGAGIFLEEARACGLGGTHRGVEPSKYLAFLCREKGFEIFQGFATHAAAEEDWSKKADLAVSFEVLEHVPNSVEFFQDIASLVRPGGLIVVSGLCGTGFDISVLGAHSQAVSPPHHLNYLSIEGVKHVLERAGLETIDIFTPGRLDVDIVQNALKNGAGIDVGPFVGNLMTRGSDKTLQEFQRFLANSGMSSHMWVIARTPDNTRAPDNK